MSTSELCLDVPVKKKNLAPNKDFISDLPEPILHQIIKHCDLSDLSNLAITSKRLNMVSLSFLVSPLSVQMTFPFMKPIAEENEDFELLSTEQLISVLGSCYIVTVNKAKRAFAMLAVIFKKMTSMMNTSTRVDLACDFLSRLEVDIISDQCFVQTRQLLNWYGLFFHTLFNGWSADECCNATGLIINKMKQHRLEEILSETFELGTCPGVEIFYKHFFSAMFYKEVPSEKQAQYLEYMLCHILKSQDLPQGISKILLLMSSSSKEDIGYPNYGVQWSDHIEAIPATLAVASSRYSKLVILLGLLQQTRYCSLLPDVLHSMFTMPTTWLPENVGSVLLLLGSDITSQYIRYLCAGCANCLNKAVTSAIVGISVMSLRFQWSFHEHAFTKFEETLNTVPDNLRESLVTAVWSGYCDELIDLRNAAAHGEDWAQEGSRYLFGAIQNMGELMMKKSLRVIRTPNNEE